MNYSYTEALNHAENSQSVMNYGRILQAFSDRGIDPSEIQPRINVFTFKAWMAKNRRVKKGEKGVRIVTFIPVKDKKTGKKNGVRPWTSVVFHITQTETVEG